VAKKKELERSSQVVPGNYSIYTSVNRALPSYVHTLATWSNADHPITVHLSDLNGKPAVSTWNENSRQLTLLIFSSWATLLCALLLENPELRSSEESDSIAKIQSWPELRSWLLSILLTCSGTPDKGRYFQRMSSDSLEWSEESSK
jgi:hypothetical protein